LNIKETKIFLDSFVSGYFNEVPTPIRIINNMILIDVNADIAVAFYLSSRSFDYLVHSKYICLAAIAVSRDNLILAFDEMG
jgi:hypothetical protein